MTSVPKGGALVKFQRRAKIQIIKNYAIYKILIIRNSKKPIIILLCKIYNVTILLLYLYVLFYIYDLNIMVFVSTLIDTRISISKTSGLCT